jgi:hypothetical protein
MLTPKIWLRRNKVSPGFTVYKTQLRGGPQRMVVGVTVAVSDISSGVFWMIVRVEVGVDGGEGRKRIVPAIKVLDAKQLAVLMLACGIPDREDNLSSVSPGRMM